VPEAPQILARYAGLQDFSTLDDPLIARLRRVLIQPSLGAADRASVEFALGRALDACEAYDEAFETYRSANRHSRDSAGPGFQDYDLSLERRFIDRLIGAFGAVPTHGSAETPAAAWPQPVFVCGMFRSGSTLVEQLLAGHSQITPGGELDFLPRSVQALAPFPESIVSLTASARDALARGYLNRLGESFPKAEYVTDKRPDNFLNIGLIKLLFPKAKIIHTVRNALDNCLSIYFLHLDQGKSYALDLMDIGHHYIQYVRLMAHWRGLYGADILDVSYDELVRNPKPGIGRMLEFIGLEWEDRCLSLQSGGRPVKTASVWQVREPLYQRSSGRSRHYQRQLQALREYLGQPPGR
jgi:tetratricopeptide (TPR) repeat protein